MKKASLYRVLWLIAAILALSAVSCSGGQGVVTSTPPLAMTETPAATVPPVSTEPPQATATDGAAATDAATATDVATATAIATATVAAPATAAESATPTLTIPPAASPMPSASPTRDFPDVTVNRQANCRYGPGMAYLYRWGLYAGDTAEVHGRNWNGSWYWIKPFNLDSHCWASEIVFDTVQGDPKSVPFVQVPLPKTTFAGPPGNVQAVRNGSEVTVSWDVVPLSDDKRRGYLIEAMVCQNGAYFPFIIQTDNTSYTFTDEGGCTTPSGGKLYTAEKHGYSDPVEIPWP